MRFPVSIELLEIGQGSDTPIRLNLANGVQTGSLLTLTLRGHEHAARVDGAAHTGGKEAHCTFFKKVLTVVFVVAADVLDGVEFLHALSMTPYHE